MKEEQERTALLFMLEDLNRSQQKIEQAHQEWIAAMDAIADPIFMHDKDYRIMRCNRAYAERAGMPFKEIIGKPYYEVFPKLDGPLPGCCKTMQQEEAEEEIQIASGETFVSRSFSVRNGDGSYLYSLHVMEDITERKRMQQALQESEEKFRQISATAQDAILMMDNVGRIVFWNRAAEKIFGYTAEETLGKDLHDLIVPERFRKAFHKNYPAFVATGSGAIIGKTLKLEAFGKTRPEFPIELSVSAAQLGGQWHAVGFIRDITERKQVEEELQLRSLLLDSTSDSVFLHDFNGNFAYLNEAAWKTRGYTRDELMGMNLHALDTPEFAAHIKMQMGELMEKGACIFESAHRRKDGSVMPVEVSARLIESGGRKLVLSVTRDITERKQAEVLLYEGAEQNRQLFESSRDALMTLAPPSWKFTRANRATLELFCAKSEAEFTALGPWNVSPEQQPNGLLSSEKAQEHIAKAMREGSNFFEWEHMRLNGKPFAADILLTRMDVGKEVFLQATMRDITERKQAEAALLHANRAFKTLSACNHELVRATDEQQLLQAMCRVIVEDGGYHAAWVGYKQDDAEQSVRPMAQSGFDPGYVDMLQITWADRERGRGPTGKSVRSGTMQVVQDVASDLDCAPWREQATQRNNTSGNASVIALPLHNNGEVLGSLTIYAAQTNAFSPKEIALLEEMAGDLAFGIRMLRLRQEQQRNATQVREGLEGTIQAIAGMVEMRDPYTAGHQQRVAQLAAAIAVEMGLPEERIHGIHLAGTIHDLGKIQTPAEILSKPGKLSALEYSLIKEHAQNGYEILKDIEFPWQIAQMVWQHHERLDGSGYPQGLKGDEILLEARILAVADVVEAMSSHRPYRPGLGIDVALEEIIKGRDVHYDPDAVDECIWLFRDKGFKFL